MKVENSEIYYIHKKTGSCISHNKLKQWLLEGKNTFVICDSVSVYNVDLKDVNRYFYNIKDIPFNDDFVMRYSNPFYINELIGLSEAEEIRGTKLYEKLKDEIIDKREVCKIITCDYNMYERF